MNHVTNIRQLRQLQTVGTPMDMTITTTIGAVEQMIRPQVASLRDQFAMAAMPWTMTCFEPEESAKEAYKYADAMLKVRNE